MSAHGFDGVSLRVLVCGDASALWTTALADDDYTKLVEADPVIPQFTYERGWDRGARAVTANNIRGLIDSVY